MKIQTQFGEALVLTQCPLLSSTEQLEWLTELHETIDGSRESELRYELREAPAQSLRFNYLNFRKALGGMFHMLQANMSKILAVPLKQIALPMPATTGSFIAFDTASIATHIAVGSYVLISSNTSDVAAEVLEIGRHIIIQDEIRDDEDEIIQELITEYQDGFRLSESVDVQDAKLMPLRICVIAGNVSMKVAHYYTQADIEFLVKRADVPLYVAAPAQQYKNDDVCTLPLLLEGDSIAMNLQQHQVVIDGQIGEFATHSDWQYPRYEKTLNVLMKSKSEYLDFYRFLYRRRGRYKAFWMPLYEKHFAVLNAATIGSSISINTDYFVEANRKHIAVKRKNGLITLHEITAKTGGSMTVSPAVNTHVNDIQIICYAGLYRFGSDNIQFEFLGKSIAKASVMILEIER